MLTELVSLRRLDLPPAVHFARSSEILVTEVHVAALEGPSTQRGIWLPTEQFLERADDQWQAVLLSLVNQLRFGLATGYLSLPGRTASATPSRPSSASAASLRAIAKKPMHVVDEAQTESRSDLELMPTGPIVTCSGYPEAEAPEGDSEEGNAPHSEAENVDAPSFGESSRGDLAAGGNARLAWRSGQVALVRDGGAEVQRALDAEGVKLGIVSWHAPWVEACLETAPFMQRLAARFLGVAVIQLDVEASMANKLVAYEKVLTRSESRRRGAKPVLRDGGAFPCLTIHEPCNLVPSHTFCGRTALDDAAQILAARGQELTRPLPEPSSASQQQPPTPYETDSSRTVDSVGLEGAVGNLTLASDTDREPVLETGIAKPATTLAAKPDDPKKLRKGATEFKQILTKAKAAHRGVVVLWLSGLAGSGGSQAAFAAQAQSLSEHSFLEIDVTEGKDNRQLAGPLGVKAFPTVQAYFNMKLVKSVGSRSAGWTSAAKALDDVAAALESTSAASGGHSPSSAQPATPHPASGESAAAEVPLGVAELEGDGPESEEPRNEPRDTTYDPPAARAKAGAKKRLSGGIAVFWPRMPCLRCGCPWWLGEDWDARCARCGWTAERDGYDDDSQPLPQYRAKFETFTALLREGRTAAYSA